MSNQKPDTYMSPEMDALLTKAATDLGPSHYRSRRELEEENERLRAELAAQCGKTNYYRDQNYRLARELQTRAALK